MLIDIIGHAGAGKTTLAKNLSRILNYKFHSIENYRKVFGDDVDAWSYFNNTQKNEHHIVCEHTGLNCLWNMPDRKDKITIKLECSLHEALKRAIPDKCDWFDDDFDSFVRYSHRACKHLHADITINISKNNEQETLIIAMQEIMKRI